MKSLVLALAIGLACSPATGLAQYGCGLPDSASEIIGVPGVDIAGGSPIEGVPRIDTYCAIRAKGEGALGFTIPERTRLFISFYYKGSANTKILSALTLDGQEILSISYIDNNIVVEVDPSDNPLFADNFTGTAPASSTKWNYIEVFWDDGFPGLMWINKNPWVESYDDMFYAGTGNIVQRVFFGALDNIGTNSIFFDRFWVAGSGGQHGLALMGDSNDDEAVNSGDVISIINEFFDAGLSSGTPDCNLDGNVNSGDVICIINKFFEG